MGDRERNKKRLLELLQAAGTGNGHCADCGAAGKGAMCGAGAASPGPWPTGCFPRSPSTRDSDSLLAWDPSPSRWRVSGDPDGPPSPCSRSPGPQSSLRIRCGPCPGSLLLSHPALTTQDPALDTISDPGPFPRPRTLRSSPRCLLGLRDPHCRAMTEDADVAGSGPRAFEQVPHLPALLGSPFRGLLGVVEPKGGLSTIHAVTSVVQGWEPREKGLPAWAELASDAES